MAQGDYFDEFSQNPYAELSNPTVGSTTRSPDEFAQAAQRSSAGYNAPNLYAAPRNQGGGVDVTKWTDPNHKTSKYEVLRYLDQFNPQQLGRAGLTALSADAKNYLQGLGYQVRDEDKIFRQDIGEIDVLHGDRTQYGWRPTGVGNVASGKSKVKPMPLPGFVNTGPTPGVTRGSLPNGGSFISDNFGKSAGQPAITPQSGQFTDPSTETFQALLMRRLEELQQAVQRPDNDQYREAAHARAEELQQAPYTAAEEQALITRMRDPLTQARDARRDVAKEQMGARNLMPSSGLYQDQVFNAVDRDYERNLAAGTNDLAVRAIDEGQRRKTASLDTLAQLVGLGNDERREDESREREVLTTGAILPELTERRLRLLMDATNGTNSEMSSLTNNLMSLWNNNQQNAQFQAGQQQTNAQQWGTILGMLLQSPLLNRGATT